ncbi:MULTISPECIES: Bug family tripartite tricarboxylate transporter substrate binding protein [Ramlibacter]|uniref:Tripartite tricarboxylate transporter substrate binding protein n=1 Tax=Ramlibacter pinisoli TaxID=2682844 RepID=A0A6N8IZQ9_9BURK|nr:MULTISPECIES: tripartite tricarboxylate transporter substrate-binding protein [Ramlibacter]MBA2962326.1 tripartite tricarboxylate transporter substrate binding protein [Ramlibacter sp. CGMCC 1.13660]MVQ32268.1 tripartite tricarboxylate transporter substrate binding protein [Ramlibacter pinisoli]
MHSSDPTALRRRHLLTLAAAAALPAASFAQPGAAAAWPDKPLRMFVGYAAGSGIDNAARQLARRIEVLAGQPVVVENRAGALGNLGAQAVAAARGDASTLLFTPNSTHAANIHLFKKLPFDPVKDFTPVSSVATLGFVLVCDPKTDVTTVQQLVAAAQREPGRWAYGTGNATGLVAGAMFKTLTGTDLLAVPYKSVPPAMTDLMGGRLQLVFADATLAIPLVRAGKLRALAVTGQRRMAALPQVPTMAESGVPKYDLTAWFAVFQPAGVAPEHNAKMASLVQRALQDPQLAESLRSIGAEPESSTPAELARRVATDTERWGTLVKLAGIEPE